MADPCVTSEDGDLDISFIIVSYNTADLIETCLNSVCACEDCRKEIFVVDNASTDGSATLILEKYPDVRFIANERNVGFAAANNQVLALCKGRYIFFLNPDTKIESTSLLPILSFLDPRPDIGLAGTRIINPDGSIQESVSFHYPGQRHARRELHGLKGRIACVLGASMIARTDLIRKVGGFDPEFFLYGEDQDLCLRIRKLGYEIGYNDACTVTHFGGQSERSSKPFEVWTKKTRAEYLFYRKHYLPATIRKIAREDICKSSWRIFTIRLILPFMTDKERQLEKLAKYRAVYTEVKKIRS